MVLVVNTSFPELDECAAAFAERGQLSAYVRPYATSSARLRKALVAVPPVAAAYDRSFGRRNMPRGLPPALLRQSALGLDFALALHDRVPGLRVCMRSTLVHARTNAIAKAAERAYSSEKVVMASWGAAQPVFARAKRAGARCVLNYSLAHHRYVRRTLLEEAVRVPAFAGTLNSHDYPAPLERRFDEEIELADDILVGSSFARDSFISEGVAEAKVHVVPYGVDAEQFQPRPPKSSSAPLRLLFVGQIGQRKGIAYLLDAMKAFRDGSVSLTLVGKIQGDPTALRPYGESFEHLEHMSRVHLPKIYAKADVFVFPTLVEGMGLVVLEAMASGLPVITTPNGPGDIVRHNVDGFLAPPRDVPALVRFIERLRDRPDERESMGKNARDRALTLNWTTYRDRVRGIVEPMLTDRGRGAAKLEPTWVS